MSSHLAIVPAYNEAGVDRARRRGAARARARTSTSSSSTTAPPTTPRDRAARPARRCCATRSTSASAAPCRPATMYAAERGYDVAVQVDGDGQHDPRCVAELLAHLQRAPGARHGHGLALPRRRRRGLPLLRAAPPRHPHLLAASCRDRRPAGDRPDVGPAHGRPPRHRAVRPRLPARLPRGRGGADDARPPALERRAAGADARAHRRRVLDQLDALGLLHDQGAAGGRRRAVPRAPDGRAPATRAGGRGARI